MPRDPEAVLDMLLAAEAVSRFIEGVDFRAFEINLEKQSAVLHQLLIMSEACKRVSHPFRASHPDVPWSLIAGMRDRLIHAYDDVDLNVVWDAVTRELPPVLVHLRRLAPQDC